MKKCGNCGAVQRDERTTCLDCGEALGRPMTEAEAERYMAELDAAVERMTDPSDDFAVPLRDKIMGVLALMGIVVLCVLLGLIGVWEDRYQPQYPEGTVLSEGMDGAVIYSAGSAPTFAANPYAAERGALASAAQAELLGILLFALAAFMLFFPRAIWHLDTIRIRSYISGEPTPSRAWVMTHRVVQYACFAFGWSCVGSVVWLIL